MSRLDDARALLDGADLICSAAEVDAAVERVAHEITAALGDS